MNPLKTLTLALMAAALVIATASCGKKEKPAPPPPQPKAEAPPQPKKIQKVVVEDKEEGSLVAKIPTKADAPDEDPKVESDDTNIAVDAEATSVAVETGRPTRGNQLPVSKIQPNSLAGKLDAVNGLHWRPAWRFKGVGGSWIVDVDLSSDGTLLAFVETTGKDDGPYGSRIVLYSVNQWKPLKIVEIERKISLFRFVPNKLEILAYCEKQAELKQPQSLIKVDLGTGLAVQATPPLKSKVTSLACSSQSVAFAAIEGESSLFAYNVARLADTPKSVPCSNNGGYLAINPNRDALASLGKSKIEIFKIDDRNLNYLMSSGLPDGMPEAGNLVFADSPSVFAVAPPYDAMSKGGAFMMRSGNAWPMVENASGLLAYDPKTQKLLAGGKAKGVVACYKMPAFDPEGDFIPADSQPRTNGVPVKIFYMSLPDAIGVLDSIGDFYFVKRSVKAKRWYKVLIFTPLR